MYFIKCSNSAIYVSSGEKYIRCKRNGEPCPFQRYCSIKRNYELVPDAEKCIYNPKNCKVEKDNSSKEKKVKVEKKVEVEKPIEKTELVEDKVETKTELSTEEKNNEKEVVSNDEYLSGGLEDLEGHLFIVGEEDTQDFSLEEKEENKKEVKDYDSNSND
jgi:hypothetical protein